ncbi:histone-lysine N-methyltransferase 2D-like [Tyto alba]|uniref:histone-lysine N-methyltransferase 2D-like n=1 Tax=Tyto alba TaxID=56313 RepID=UPI001C673E0A|nr:histone-lysine N-methyltransferase 2D-like [Tyto alba]
MAVGFGPRWPRSLLRFPGESSNAQAAKRLCFQSSPQSHLWRCDMKVAADGAATQRGCRGAQRGAESGGRGRQELPKRPGAGPLRAAASGAQAGPWAPAAGTPVPARPALRDACPGPAEVSCSFPLSFALSPPACMLCGRAEADPDICGYKLQKRGLCAHLFCLFFANGLFQKESHNVGLMGFPLRDIRHTVEQAAQQRCFVCGESGAAITCCQEGCDRSFHLPCAVEGECVMQFCGLYRSFCWQHRPEQAVEAAPGENTACLICLDPVEDRKSYGTMVCPACKHAWFHRACIQGQAARAGICFQCPFCRDRRAFLKEMLTMGIRIPFRLPSWENGHADDEQNERHSRCDARECLCPGGRQHTKRQGPWQLLLCCSCAAEGTHRRCSHLGTGAARWECNSCAGLGTASSGSSEVAGPITESHTGLQAASGPSQSSPVPESSSCSSPPGPDRVRDRARSRRSAQKPYSRPTRHRGRSSAPARRAERSTPGQLARGRSHSSLVPESSSPSTSTTAASGSSSSFTELESSSPSSTGGQGASGPSQSSSPPPESSSCSSPPGPDRVRDRSRSRRRAQKPYSRRTRGRGRSRAPAPRAESSSPAQSVPGCSRGSPVPETGSPSTPSSARLQSSRRPSRPGPVRGRDRSRLRRRAQNPYSRPGR